MEPEPPFVAGAGAIKKGGGGEGFGFSSSSSKPTLIFKEIKNNLILTIL